MSEGHKEVLYLDVEDDITSIISKVKASKHKVIAVVPPKRIGVLQSAVNLRLLARAAKQDEKHLVLITNNHALLTLAASAALPVAKNLQTKPELAEVPTVEDSESEEDVIHGAELPVGEHASQVGDEVAYSGDTAGTNDITAGLAAVAAKADELAATNTTKPVTKATAKNSSVPNFDMFRKKLFLGIGGGIVLVAFLVWAFVFAPRATVVIAAKTTSSSVNAPVTVSTTATTSYEKGTLLGVMQQIQSPKSVEFSPTGQKDAGTKATGTVKLSAQSLTGVYMAAGTPLQSTTGLTFLTDKAVSVPASSFGPGCFPTACAGTASVGVTATENGSKYNAASGSLSGAPTNVSASFTGPTSGGVSKMVTVVSKDDIDKAKETLVAQNLDSVKKELKAKFGDTSLPIDQSFVSEFSEVTSSPELDTEASAGKATLTVKVSYKMYGVAKTELASFVEAYVKKDTNGLVNQRIYEDGTKNAVFQEVTKSENGAKATLIATAQVGPKIDTNEVKRQVKGKRFGEIQQQLQAIQGVDSVDVKFFPFWVSSVPNDDKKIVVEFKLNGTN